MKVLLISPERERKNEEAFLFRLSFLNLPYVAAVTPSDVEVKIVDEALEKVDFNENVTSWVSLLRPQPLHELTKLPKNLKKEVFP